MTEKRFPVGGVGSEVTIPWSVAEEAHLVYAKRYGTSQTLERLAQRGGFYPEELDDLRPGWRPVTLELDALRARVAELERALRSAGEAPIPAGVRSCGNVAPGEEG